MKKFLYPILFLSILFTCKSAFSFNYNLTDSISKKEKPSFSIKNFEISTMVFRNGYGRPNINFNYEMKPAISLNLGLDWRAHYVLRNYFYYYVAVKFNIGPSIDIIHKKKFSFQFNPMFLMAFVQDYEYRGYKFGEEISSGVANFTTFGLSGGLGIKHHISRHFFYKFNACFQYLPFKQKFERIHYLDGFSEQRPTHINWKYPWGMGTLFEVQFSVGYQF